MIHPNTRPSRPVILSALLILGAGCGVTTPSSTSLSIDMFAATFVRDSTTLAAVIPLALNNHDSVTVYVPGCGPRPLLTLQQWTATGWQDVTSLLGCISNPAPIALASGAILADTQRCALVGTFRYTVSYGLSASQPLNVMAWGSAFAVQ
jgi:hypothetical protein